VQEAAVLSARTRWRPETPPKCYHPLQECGSLSARRAQSNRLAIYRHLDSSGRRKAAGSGNEPRARVLSLTHPFFTTKQRLRNPFVCASPTYRRWAITRQILHIGLVRNHGFPDTPSTTISFYDARKVVESERSDWWGPKSDPKKLYGEFGLIRIPTDGRWIRSLPERIRATYAACPSRSWTPSSNQEREEPVTMRGINRRLRGLEERHTAERNEHGLTQSEVLRQTQPTAIRHSLTIAVERYSIHGRTL